MDEWTTARALFVDVEIRFGLPGLSEATGAGVQVGPEEV